jgi:hypothetical protein
VLGLLPLRYRVLRDTEISDLSMSDTKLGNVILKVPKCIEP